LVSLLRNAQTASQDLGDLDRFKLAAAQIVGKRLTWNEVTGKNHEPQMCRPN